MEIEGHPALSSSSSTPTPSSGMSVEGPAATFLRLCAGGPETIIPGGDNEQQRHQVDESSMESSEAAATATATASTAAAAVAPSASSGSGSRSGDGGGEAVAAAEGAGEGEASSEGAPREPHLERNLRISRHGFTWLRAAAAAAASGS